MSQKNSGYYQDFSSKELIEEKIRQSIKEKNFNDLENSIIAAEEYGCSEELLEKSFSLLGDDKINEENFRDAIYYYNRARRIQPRKERHVNYLAMAIEGFYVKIKGGITKKDAGKIRECLSFLSSFYKKISVDKKELEGSAKKFKDLNIRVRYHKKYKAKDVSESKYSHEVDQVYKFICENLNDEEAYSEVARIIEPVIKEIIDSEEEGDYEDEN